MPLRGVVLVLVFALAGAAGPLARAESMVNPDAAATGEAAAGTEEASGPEGFWEIVRASGWIGLILLLLSVGAVALCIEHVMTIRAAVLMPPGLAEDVRALLGGGHLAQARQRLAEQPSFLAFTLGAGLEESDSGWQAVEKAMEDATAEQSARLFRKVEYLSVIGNIAPMLGLLGTVIGMVLAFREVAGTQGVARAADLAQGIYLALVTTIVGLIVAIPALAAFAFFRNRVDELTAEVAYAAQHAMAPLKRARPAASRPRVPAPPPVGGVG